MLLGLKYYRKEKSKVEKYISGNNISDRLKLNTWLNSAYLNGYFGAHGSRQLMDDLCIQTASVVHIPNHYWE